jgi:hypothetical protein
MGDWEADYGENNVGSWRRTSESGLTRRASRGEKGGWWRRGGGMRTDATGLVEGDRSGGRQVRTEGGWRVARGEGGWWRRGGGVRTNARELVEGDGSGGRHIGEKGIRRRGDSREAHDVRADSIGRRADPRERRKKSKRNFSLTFILYRSRD